MEFTLDLLLAHDPVELFWRQIGVLAKLLMLALLAMALAVVAVISAVRSWHFRDVAESSGFVPSFVACLFSAGLVYFVFSATRFQITGIILVATLLPPFFAASALFISVINLLQSRFKTTWSDREHASAHNRRNGIHRDRK